MISWKCKHTWKKSAQNTAWCLLGCSIGDFGTIFYFQNNPSDLFNTTLSIMILAIINGLMTSIALETFILSKQMSFREALKTAFGMSFISMISLIPVHFDYHRCGDSPPGADYHRCGDSPSGAEYSSLQKNPD